jgi:hypothetical protein
MIWFLLIERLLSDFCGFSIDTVEKILQDELGLKKNLTLGTKNVNGASGMSPLRPIWR